MRHHNRARLIDIADNKLNPKQKLVAGKDGRLVSPRKTSEEKEVKPEKAKEPVEVQVPLEEAKASLEEASANLEKEEVSEVPVQQDKTTEKKTKKKSFGKI